MVDVYVEPRLYANLLVRGYIRRLSHRMLIYEDVTNQIIKWMGSGHDKLLEMVSKHGWLYKVNLGKPKRTGSAAQKSAGVTVLASTLPASLLELSPQVS